MILRPPIPELEHIAEEARAMALDGVPLAMYSLSICYLYGMGVPQSLALSRIWALRCQEAMDSTPCTGRPRGTRR